MSVEFWISTAVIFGLLGLSGFFSGSETALTAASKARLNAMVNAGDKRAGRVMRLIEDKERLIGAILLGNNLVNISASALATGVLITAFGEEGVVYATFIMTALILIFAEVLPKSYAIANPDRMALWVAIIIQPIVILFAPIVSLVQRVVRLTLKIFGISLTEGDTTLSPQEEIRGTIDLHGQDGSLVKEDKQMLGGILDLDDIMVEDVMVHRKSMQAIDVALASEDIVNLVVKSPFTRLPVYDGDLENIVGVLHAKDVLRSLRHAGGSIKDFQLKRIMSAPWFVPDTTTLREQLNAFRERKSHFALVVDEYGSLLGLITLEDILEEIVGEIEDEHDTELPGVKQLADGSVMAEGSVTIRDLNRALEWDLPDNDATTIAGLVLHEAETIPIAGQRVQCRQYWFEVTKRRRNQITELKISRA